MAANPDPASFAALTPPGNPATGGTGAGEPVAAGTQAVQRWVTLHWDRFILALPQHEVQSVELSADVQEALPHEVAAGWFPASPKPWPVYRFDDRMWPAQGIRKDGFVMILHGEEPWGIWGEGVNVEKGEETLRLLDMPAVFTRTVSPATGLAVSAEGRPVLICSGYSLGRWVQGLQARRLR